MKFPTPAVDYRKVRLHNLNSAEYRHLLLLLYWPLYGLLFLYVERFSPTEYYHPVSCALDAYIPFQELFLIPYLFWFVYLIGMLLYTLLYDVRAFRRMMYFIIFTYSITILFYLIYPTCQNLRPAEFARDNLLTRFTAWFYRFDTNTNVCPSIHVLGSAAAMFAGLDCRAFRRRGRRIALIAAALLISVSTVFLKQHSVLDVLAALPLCAAAYLLVYARKQVKTAA